MLNLNGLAQLLKTHQIEAEDLETLAIDGTTFTALALDIAPAQQFEVWQIFRNLVEQTGRYPLLVEDWIGGRTFFSTYWYEAEVSAGHIADVTPDAVLAAVPQADMQAFLVKREAMIRDELAEGVDFELELTQQQFGSCPAKEEVLALVDQGVIQSPVSLNRWLFDWELQTFGLEKALEPPDPGYLGWFDPNHSQATMLLLPVTEGWNTLAYLHWYGSLTGGTPVTIQFLKKWHDDYQAELVCHYATMLGFYVGQPPRTPEDAFRLAWEQVALAECTTILPGVSLRDHARSLLAVNRWFLHERP
ncbi:MAG: DUF4253 domain-containing protein [Chloroflexaceae bacterium]|jgi:hypothetical protein|nr:DUF4253 domain-containing protein [Chloroflexaceae bacterium]